MAVIVVRNRWSAGVCGRAGQELTVNWHLECQNDVEDGTGAHPRKPKVDPAAAEVAGSYKKAGDAIGLTEDAPYHQPLF